MKPRSPKPSAAKPAYAAPQVTLVGSLASLIPVGADGPDAEHGRDLPGAWCLERWEAPANGRAH